MGLARQPRCDSWPASPPTQGRVTTHGRVASLLNVGAGFHPELTGRENVLLNAVILGLSRREALRRYEEIVDFAGLDAAFMDTPVKHYSSGMYARLAFAVAVHVAPDVLLVDEVLSVGDAEFQDRSLRRMLEFRDRRQAALVFVSHNLAALELMCPRAIWLERGTPRAIGATTDVLRAYLDAVDAADDDLDAGHVVIDRVEVLDSTAPADYVARQERAHHRARPWPRAAGAVRTRFRRLHPWRSRTAVRGQHAHRRQLARAPGDGTLRT